MGINWGDVRWARLQGSAVGVRKFTAVRGCYGYSATLRDNPNGRITWEAGASPGRGVPGATFERTGMSTLSDEDTLKQIGSLIVDYVESAPNRKASIFRRK